jgi:hypothetical protein
LSYNEVVIVDLPTKPLDSLHTEHCFECRQQLEQGEQVVNPGAVRYFHADCFVKWARR